MFGRLLFDSFAHNAADVRIPLVGDNAFRIVVQLLFAVGDVLLQMTLQFGVQSQLCQDLLIAFKDFDGVPAQITGADQTADGFFNVGDCVLHAAVKYMRRFGGLLASGQLRRFLSGLHSALALEGAHLHHSAAQRFGKLFQVDLIAVFMHQIDHIHRHNHGQPQLDQLRGQIEISLDIDAVHNVQNGVGLFVD